MSQFGLSLSVGSLAGSPFVNFALLGCADLVAKISFTMFMRAYSKKRKRLTIVTFVGLGVTCLALSVLLKLTQSKQIIVVLFVIGKFLASITVTAAYLLLAESFPTECRLLGKNTMTTKNIDCSGE